MLTRWVEPRRTFAADTSRAVSVGATVDVDIVLPASCQA